MYLNKGALISGDAGHNCIPDVGAKGIRQEEKCNKEIWNLVRHKLNILGYLIEDCTPWNEKFDHKGASLNFRVKKANESKSLLHLSIHFNEINIRGVECWVLNNNGKAAKLAKQICAEIATLGYYNRGVKVGINYILEYTDMPSIIIKCASINNKEDMDRYDANKIAAAIVKGITGYYV